jgi:predicted P-loop ATPase
MMATRFGSEMLHATTSPGARVPLHSNVDVGTHFFRKARHLGRADTNRAKAFMSTSVDRLRKPFGRVSQDFPRQNVFAVTLNPFGRGYLKDETGNRRYWPIRCGATWKPDQRLERGKLIAVRDQLWAEAVRRFNQGEAWWLTERELEQAQAESTAAREDVSLWHEDIEQFIEGKTEVATEEIWCECFGVRAIKDRTPQQLWAIAATLTRLGWERGYVRVEKDGKPVRLRGYKKKPQE